MMKISHFAAIVAVAAVYTIPVLAQTPNTATNTTDSKAKTTQPSKQPTQGLPQSMANPQYGSAKKQNSQGVPSSLANPQYGGAYTTQKQQ